MTFLQKLAYGSGDTPLALFFTTMSIYLMFFLTDVAAIPPVLAAWVFSIGRIWDAFSDPIMGHLSDRTKTRWGRRRPYLLFGAPILGLSFILLWQQYSIEPVILRLLAYGAISLVFFTSFTVVAVPYASLVPELTLDYDERTSLTGYRMAFSLIMGITAAAVPGLFIAVPKESLASGFSTMAVVLGIAGIIPSFIVFAVMRERFHEKKFEKINLFKSYKDLFKNKAFLVTIGIYLFAWVPMDILGATLIYYMKYVMKMEEMLNVILLTMFGTAALCLPLWNAISARLEKKSAYMIGGAVIVITIIPLTFLPAHTPLWGLIIIAAGAGIGLSAAHLFPWALIPECIDLDEARHGVRREGIFTGFFSFSQKLASSLAIIIVGSALSWMDYVPGIEKEQSALTAIRFLSGIIPAIFFIASVILASRYPISREDHKGIRKSLDCRE